MSVLSELLKSKKFVASLIGVVMAIGMQFGIPEATMEEIIGMLSPILVYIGAQGFADMGKGAKQVDGGPK